MCFFQVSGSLLTQTLDLRKIEKTEDWSPDCENVTASVTSNRYKFTMRSVNCQMLIVKSFHLFFIIFSVNCQIVSSFFFKFVIGPWWRILTGKNLLAIGVDL